MMSEINDGWEELVESGKFFETQIFLDDVKSVQGHSIR